jgi:hypothetical protein
VSLLKWRDMMNAQHVNYCLHEKLQLGSLFITCVSECGVSACDMNIVNYQL